VRFRVAPLRQAVIFAAVFVCARVVYAAVFAGAGGAGIRLLALPLIVLPAPFTGVRLLGPVALDGVGAVALSAVPFAAVIVGFGLLNALFDVRPWFAAAARRGPLRSFARALVIAWQTLPALALALRRAARAAQLRGERPGPRVLVPVLEDAIERAVALAASLELRGFAAARRVEGACAVPVRVTDAVLSRPGWALSIPALSLAPGTLTVLTGATGSGKSTVLDALSGLFQHVGGGTQRGVIDVGGSPREEVPPRETAGFVGVVAQRVRPAFVGETVTEELGCALALRGVAPVIVAARVAEVAGRLGIAALLDRPISDLSAGEAELVAIGAALAERPALLLVDEPLAELDAAARPRVVEALANLAHSGGMCVVVAEHRTSWFESVADGWLHLAAGELSVVPSAPLRSGPQWCPPDTNGVGAAPMVSSRVEMVSSRAEMVSSRAEMVSSSKSGGGDVVEVRGVGVRHGARQVVDDVSFGVRAGEIVALTGANGAGKSSLLEALALPAESGRVLVRGDDVHAVRPRARHSAIALVPEGLEDLFVTDSVAAECRRADRHGTERHGGHGPTLARFGALAATDPAALADTHPRDLSGGQRMCLAIALQLAAAPAVLLVDEPTRGLDATARAEVAAALRRAAQSGTAVLFATHEADFARELAHRTLRLQNGRLENDRLENDRVDHDRLVADEGVSA
jgi:energy-coupling factor transport system ATP-binding protein